MPNSCNTNYCRPCQRFKETVVPCTVKKHKTQKQPPFTMAIHHSHSTTPILSPSYCIKYIALLNTIISSGHNYVWQYFVSLSIEMEFTLMMWSMFKTYIPQYCVLPPSQNSCPVNKIKGVLIGCLLVISP